MKYSVKNLDVNHVLLGVESLDIARPGYEKAKEFYEGNPPEIVGDDRVAAKLRKTGKDYVLRMSKTPVDYMSDRVKIQKVTTTEDAIDAMIDEIEQANNMSIWGQSIIKNAFIKGDSYVLVVPVDAEDEDESEAVRKAGVRITQLNPETTRAIYDDLGSDPIYIVREYLIGKRRVIEVYYTDGVAVWITVSDNANVSHPTSWTPFITDENPEGWFEYPFTALQIPIFHVRADTFLDSPYGKPEHYDAFGAQNAINSALLTQIESMKESGFPQRYQIEKDNADDQGGVPEIDFSGEGDFNPAMQQSRGQVGGPGTILNDPRVASYGQFNAADPSGFLSAVDFYVRLMSQTTGTPLYAFDPSKEMSGISRQNADAPLRNKIENRTTRLGAVFGNIYKFALSLKGVPITLISVKWKNQGLAYESLEAANKVADTMSKLSGTLATEQVRAIAIVLLDDVLEIDLVEIIALVDAQMAQQVVAPDPAAEVTQAETDTPDGPETDVVTE